MKDTKTSKQDKQAPSSNGIPNSHKANSNSNTRETFKFYLEIVFQNYGSKETIL